VLAGRREVDAALPRHPQPFANRGFPHGMDPIVVGRAVICIDVYERIVVRGPQSVGVRLTPAAYQHGLALALPDAVMARPTGVGRAPTAYRVPIRRSG
jgi:hypothetical protein